MPILLDTPVVINQETKVFDGIWVTGFVTNFPSVTEGYVRIETKPFCTTTGEILNVEPIVISSDKIWQIINDVPEAKEAMEHIINAIPEIDQWIKNKKNPPVVVEENIVPDEVNPDTTIMSISKSVKQTTWDKFKAFWNKQIF